MSNRYKGGIISATPPTTTGGEDGVASGTWTLEQQMQAQAAGLWPAQPTGPWIEDCFSTWLYTGNGATQTITNGINLSGKGGLVWAKPRSVVGNNTLYDTARGVSKALISNSAVPEQDYSGNGVTSFNSNGFAVTDSGPYAINDTGKTYVSWAFREQPKFFDIQTWTGSGANRIIPHDLGSVPGCIMVKCITGGVESWAVWHNSLTNAFSASTNYLILNSTDAQQSSTNRFDGTQITSTGFGVKRDGNVNDTGKTYIAYIFAHNAGGFGLSGTDNVISCGSFTCPSSGGVDVNLGYEPQWILTKKISGAENWNTWDTMRGWALTNQAFLAPNNSNAEVTFSGTDYFYPTATGFRLNSSFGLIGDYIYIAIRRGPMAVPTDGTSVYNGVARTGTSSATTISAGFTTDLIMDATRGGGAKGFWDRLRGATRSLFPYSTGAEFVDAAALTGFDSMTGVLVGADGANSLINNSSATYINWMFRRAPGFFDVVCYTGNGGYVSRSHNLAAVPEMMIVKARSASGYNWAVYHSALGFENYVRLNTTAASAGTGDFWYLTPTATQFSTGGYVDIDDTGVTYVNYLFASAPGVSKVGSYTGTGTTQTIDCGFTAGSRFVLIKRTDSTGDWYVWDSARGIVAGDDPYLLLNSTAAEVTNTDYIDTTSVGFEITSTAPAAINASGGTFIFLAIA